MENDRKEQEHKTIPTVVTAKYTGDKGAVAQADRRVPDNPCEVIARNTKETVCRGCKCGKE